jgi:hypothetical protein
MCLKECGQYLCKQYLIVIEESYDTSAQAIRLDAMSLIMARLRITRVNKLLGEPSLYVRNHNQAL